MEHRSKEAFLEEQLAAAIEVNQHLAHQIEELHNQVDSLKKQLKQAHEEAATAALQQQNQTPSIAAPQVEPKPAPKPIVEKQSSEEPVPAKPQQQPPPLPPLPQGPITLPSTNNWNELRALGSQYGWLLDSSDITLGPVLGEGAFGTTYKGVYKGFECAVKMIRIDNGATEVSAFSREVLALSLIRHPNVLSMYGAVIEPPEKSWIVCEYLSGSSLSQWLYGAPGSWPPKRSIVDRLRIALNIASGMAALHAHDPPILHRDLKPGNIMLDGAGRARVCDMGLARILDMDSIVSLTPETGSYLWMAPEMVRHDLYLTPADVWSFGIVLVELLSQKRPYNERHLTPVQVALAVADGNISPTIPSDAPAPLVRLLKDIFKQNPMARPAFDTIAAVLQKVVAGLEQQRSGDVQQQQKPAWQKWLSKPE